MMLSWEKDTYGSVLLSIKLFHTSSVTLSLTLRHTKKNESPSYVTSENVNVPGSGKERDKEMGSLSNKGGSPLPRPSRFEGRQ